MAIYDANGNELFSAFDADGRLLPYAYDADGRKIFAYQIDLTVMTYNVRWWSGHNALVDMQKEIIDGNNPDIIGFEEMSNNAVAQSVLTNYPFLRMATSYDCPALSSKETPSNVSVVFFEHQAPSSAGDHGRYYVKGYYTVNGKTVCVMVTHLVYKADAETLQAKYGEMMELLEAAEQEEYCIILGDFNMYAKSETGADYINMYVPFIEAGYNLANCSPSSGWTPSYGTGKPTSISELTSYIDNIIVSPNIDIIDVIFDTTKLKQEWWDADTSGDGIDHIPIIAKLKLQS